MRRRGQNVHFFIKVIGYNRCMLSTMRYCPIFFCCLQQGARLVCVGAESEYKIIKANVTVISPNLKGSSSVSWQPA